MQIQLGEPHGPCALHLAPLAESPPEPAARSSPLPSVTPFRQPRGRAAQPSGLRSANFYKPDGGWQANQGWLGKQPPCSSSPPDRKRCNKNGREKEKKCFKNHHGVSELRSEFRALESQSAGSSARRSVQRRWERAPALPRGRWTGERECVCARVCPCERGLLGYVCAWRYVLGMYGFQGKPQLHTD